MFERIQSLSRRLVSCGLPLALAACSSGSGDRVGVLFVESCSLGCNNGSGGDQVFCQIINAFQNQEIAINFSQPIDPVSVDASTFRVVQVNNGTSPGGQFLIDPANPKRLIFRPSLTFDQNGSPVYGFKANTSYQVTIPGEAQGDNPPFIRSKQGRRNQSRLQCTIFTDQGVQDPVPGRPSARLFVDVVTSYDANGDPLTIMRDKELTMDAIDTIDVARLSKVKFVFSEIMNPATVVNNQSGTSNFIFVQTDLDGMVETDNDRTNVAGSYQVVVNQANLTTTATFTPSLGYPTGGLEGVPPTNPVFARLTNSVADVVGNTITDDPRGITFGFFPERRTFPPIELPRPGGETFALAAGMPGSLEDAERSGANWGGGRLSRGEGGGSGRLGDLVVHAGETVVFDTDSTTFPVGGQILDFLGNKVGMDFPGQGTNTIEVTDGAFEFGKVFVEAGGVLRFTGAGPARLFSRGPLIVASDGLIDVSGGTPEPHDSSIALPTLGKRVFKTGPSSFGMEDITTPFGQAGPGAGSGGYGADRWNHQGNASILALPAPSDALDLVAGAGVPGNPAGRDGQGVAAQNIGRGRGGIRFPNGNYPTEDTNATGNLERLNYNVDMATDECVARQVGGAGSGGGFAFVGGEGLASSVAPIAEFPPAGSNLPANTPGGDPGTLLGPPNENSTGYVVRTLEYYGGSLRGGAGGGGGGNHTYETSTSDVDAPPDCFGDLVSMIDWHDHSGAPGGGGGGAIQARSGTSVAINGVIDASGGDGGSGAVVPQYNPVFGRFAMPGGGGSGGGIMLGAPMVTLGAQPGRLDVSGGAGGATNMAQPPTEILALGGAGSSGIVRIEDSAGNVSRPALSPSVLPAGNVGNDFGLAWISVVPGQWNPSKRKRPESLSGSSSCWVRPAGNFLKINYDSDDGPTSDEQGWNMDVIFLGDLQGAEVMIPFRGMNTVSNEIPDFEAMFGNLMNHGQPDGMGSPVAIRFQGARITAPTGTDFCGIDLDDPIIEVGSVTPWVEHPEELNDFTPIPNAMRFAVVFDRSVMPYATNNGNPTTVPAVRGVTNLLIKASPE